MVRAGDVWKSDREGETSCKGVSSSRLSPWAMGLGPIGYLRETAEDTHLSAVPLRSEGAGYLFGDFCPSLVRTAPGWASRCFQVGAGGAGGNRIQTGCQPPLPNSLAVPTAHAESQSRKRKGLLARDLVAFWVVVT